MRDPAITSRMMAAVRSKNSKAELAVRRELHRRGIRYRVHASDVTGRPDIAWRGRRVAVFIDGDFWHGNAWRLRGFPSLGDLFPTKRDWWVAKIEANQRRDAEVTERLTAEGWAVLRFWESDVLADADAVADLIEAAIRAA